LAAGGFFSASGAGAAACAIKNEPAGHGEAFADGSAAIVKSAVPVSRSDVTFRRVRGFIVLLAPLSLLSRLTSSGHVCSIKGTSTHRPGNVALARWFPTWK
jgi:hypothetical protein